MMVSTRGRYALQVLIELGETEDAAKAEGTAEVPVVSLKTISERQGISIKYLEVIAGDLLKAGLLKSYRGKAGGYRLSRPAEEYTVAEILSLTEEKLSPVACLENKNGEGIACDRAGFCRTLPMWQKLDGLIDGYLSSVTLRDLLDGSV